MGGCLDHVHTIWTHSIEAVLVDSISCMNLVLWFSSYSFPFLVLGVLGLDSKDFECFSSMRFECWSSGVLSLLWRVESISSLGQTSFDPRVSCSPFFVLHVLHPPYQRCIYSATFPRSFPVDLKGKGFAMDCDCIPWVSWDLVKIWQVNREILDRGSRVERSSFQPCGLSATTHRTI